ncbi:PspA/IM30 family protein [Paenibacillus timonensis]|jgi:phage shock protein A|uniref:PspA/IM30 family protein n=1 Tax=Paenibacillus timonensis TaxID=225915 RepID=A0ABW3SCE6_9BACL|nr:PspA/IM30 family protein [Paenibacillus timonensis]MCH1639909.1 PspA/IM30 family protein [Paenibacillus timonensis]
MGIFGRMKDMAAADTHHLLDRMEDPVSMAKYYIRQLEDQIDHARQALRNQLAAEQHYDLLIAQTGQLIEKRTRQAGLAVDREQDEIAKLAIQEKLHHDKLRQTYLEQREVIRKQTAALKGEIGRLVELHQELGNKLTFLLARRNAMTALRATSAAVTAGDTGKIVRGFDRMEQKVMRLEAEVTSYQAVDQAGLRLADWSEQDEVQAELAKLKAAKQSS